MQMIFLLNVDVVKKITTANIYISFNKRGRVGGLTVETAAVRLRSPGAGTVAAPGGTLARRRPDGEHKGRISKIKNKKRSFTDG